MQMLAHVTQNEVPAFWLAALVGFVAGVTVTLHARTENEVAELASQ